MTLDAPGLQRRQNLRVNDVAKRCVIRQRVENMLSKDDGGGHIVTDR